MERRTYGHGLEVGVWVARDPSDYSQDLRLELDGAAKIFASLAGSDLSLRWDYVEVLFTNEYGKMPPRGRIVVGVADVLIKRKAIELLREKGAQAEEYARSWKLLSGYKGQPDSEELLVW